MGEAIRDGEGLQHAFCCRVRDETGELNLEEGENTKSFHKPPDSLSRVCTC